MYYITKYIGVHNGCSNEESIYEWQQLSFSQHTLKNVIHRQCLHSILGDRILAPYYIPSSSSAFSDDFFFTGRCVFTLLVHLLVLAKVTKPHLFLMAEVHTDEKITADNMSSSIKALLDNMAAVAKRNGINTPRLVAVSKTKPAEMVKVAYDDGIRHFGENYVQELIDKSNHPLLCQLHDIHWHFVGHLQSNKANSLVSNVPHLWMIETIDSNKIATNLNTSWSKLDKPHKLKVLVQVNTSREESKHGCPPEGVLDLTRHILNSCPYLEFNGLMTIGHIALSHDYTSGPNPDFVLMKQLQLRLIQELGLESPIELSMGMSSDYEEAIKAGSTNVRIGSTIFGARTYK